jgi:predicted acylesterase/phospholipase RssA
MNPDNASIEELLRAANTIGRGGDYEVKFAFRIAKNLAKHQRLDDARRLVMYTYTEDDSDAVLMCQRWALWTSKNPDAPDDIKHDDALEILDRIRKIRGGEPLGTTTDAETLGIAGGICKRKWFALGERRALEQSRDYYERGAAQGTINDNGYTAVNAAFVRDLIASLDGGTVPTKESSVHRQNVIDVLIPLENQPVKLGQEPRGKQRWFHETVAEAHFGLGEYANATERLRRVDWKSVEPWERETTARQFAGLARLASPAGGADDFSTSSAWATLRDAFGGDALRGAGSLFSGKLGLALSGGGFRASFFHIGVLAGLAELDVLRHVEVLSCVSGGSIVGAHFYLKMRKLLTDDKTDHIDRSVYVRLVEELAHEFLEGVQKNIRTRVAGNPFANLKMLYWPGYSRTNRLGALYEKHLFARAGDDGKRKLRELKIEPGGNATFLPKYDNWQRSSKVPILVLNATTLNTGHCWQFTVSSMGEPPNHIDSKIDGNYRLRRMWLETEAPRAHRDITIGEAAAASSCVPGLFTPLELKGLYEGDTAKKPITVRLVDGGVHDNQGVYGLLEQNCQVMVVSDATGQMGATNDAGSSPLGVLMRSNEIGMARIRTSQFHSLDQRRQSKRLRGLLYLHLKDELPVTDRDWVGCERARPLSAKELQKKHQSLTSFGVLKTAQEMLSRIRTDLDSFSDVEAFALMADGCRMVRTKYAEGLSDFQSTREQHPWQFLEFDSMLTSPVPELEGRRDQLEVASWNAFKVWKLNDVLRTASFVLGAGLLVLLGFVAVLWRGEPIATVRGAVAAVATAAIAAGLTALGVGLLVRMVRFRSSVLQISCGVVLAFAASVASWIHIALFDRIFLGHGKLRALKPPRT